MSCQGRFRRPTRAVPAPTRNVDVRAAAGSDMAAQQTAVSTAHVAAAIPTDMARLDPLIPMPGV